MAKDFKYSAFISYSHTDKQIVKWLHKALEGYRLPGHLVGKETPEGVISKKLKPFFRDRDDLAASTDLGESVRTALRRSKFLIVICSPEAAKSEWVNQEILEFKKLRDEQKILCLIVGGEPNASATGRKQSEECFPPSLRKLSGKKGFEPIAADARAGGDGKQLAKLKLIAGILGIELDKLVQRDAQRHQKRQSAILGSSLAGVVVLSVLLVFAIEARKDAEDARNYAEEKRGQAEDLVEFLLEDLMNNIAPTGSLEVMGDIAMQALGYYAALDIEDVNADILGRRSQILLTLAEIEKRRGNMEQAKGIFEQAFMITEELLAQQPENSQRLFDHSQSLFWMAALDLQQGNFDQAEAQFLLYADYAKRLAEIEPENLDWQFEVGYAHSNLGTLYYNQGMFADAEREFEKQLKIFQILSENDPDSIDLQYELAQSRDWFSDSQLGQGKLSMAKEQREQELEIYQNLLALNPQNNRIKRAMLVTRQRLGLINYFQGDTEGATGHYKTGISIGEELITFDPENTGTVAKLIWLYLDYIEFLDPEPGTDEKNTQIEKAKGLTRFLVARDKTNPEWVMLYYRSHLLEARALFKAGRVAEALEIAETAHAGLYSLWQENPDNYYVLGPMGFSALVLADGYDLNNQPESANLVLKNYIETAGLHEKRMTVRAQDFLARAWLRFGLFENAKQKQDFFDKIGYRSPDFLQYWEKWAAGIT